MALTNLVDRIYSGLFLAADILPKGGILQFDKTLLIKMGIQWFNTILLTVALINILYKPVKKYMENRSERIKNDIEAARLSNEKALELKASYEKMIENIEKERREILAETHRMAVERSDQILLAARQEAKHLINKAENEIEVERENATESIKRQIIELSLIVAARFVEVSIDRKTQDRYIEEALMEWSEVHSGS